MVRIIYVIDGEKHYVDCSKCDLDHFRGLVKEAGGAILKEVELKDERA